MATKKKAPTPAKKPYRFEFVVEYDVSKCSPADIVEDISEMVKEYSEHACVRIERATLITPGEISFLK